MNSSFTDQLPDWLKEYNPQILQAGAGLLFLLVVILIILWIKKNQKKTTTPSLLLASFQIAPLGKDAFIKFSNPKERLTLLGLEIIGRSDIHIKNQVAGHILSTGASYSILMEATSVDRIENNFKIAVSFVDDHRKTYRQVFTIDPIASVSVKKVKI